MKKMFWMNYLFQNKGRLEIKHILDEQVRTKFFVYLISLSGSRLFPNIFSYIPWEYLSILLISNQLADNNEREW